MFRWQFAILEAIHSLGGEAHLPQVYEVLDAYYPLNDKDRKTTVHGRRPAFQHQVRSHVSNLRHEGYLVRQGRGVYSMTYQGKERFLSELAQYDPDSPILIKERDRKRFLLDVHVEPLEEGGFLAVCPSIQGCHAEGVTVGEALENLEDAANVLLELRKRQGWPLPESLDEYSPATSLKAQLVIAEPERLMAN